jgi:hypothetical protein
MKWRWTVALCLLFACAGAQSVQVMVPAQPVVKGTAFQVQYVLEEPQNIITTFIPTFDSCRIVSGPNYYRGVTTKDGQTKPIQNITYTLVPLQAGVLKISSLQAEYKTGAVGSGIAAVEVVEPPKASYKTKSSFTDAALYAPQHPAAMDKLIAENLFIKTIVSKTVCLIGEPVVATFKLYSRLQSSSEALNAPSFYGFSVTDMLPINEAHTGVEVINGKIYNTAILRQVQLYAEQAGTLTIDPLQVESEIEFEDTVQHRKLRVNRQMASPAVQVFVKALPSKEPNEFQGAVGNFRFSTALSHTTVRTGEPVQCLMTIKGSGNFMQIASPDVQWPNGLVATEVAVNETFNRNAVPIEGNKVYVYELTAEQPGNYQIPAVVFSFYHPSQKKYVVLRSVPLSLTVKPGAVQRKRAVSTPGGSAVLLFTAACVVLSLIAVFLFVKRKKANEDMPKKETPVSISAQLLSLQNTSLAPKELCGEISALLYGYLKERSGSLSKEKKAAIQAILAHCNEAAYHPNAHVDAALLLEQAIELKLSD